MAVASCSRTRCEDKTEAEPIEFESRASFEVYEDEGGEWRWRLVHENGNFLADSGEGYTARNDAEEAVNRVNRHAPAPTRRRSAAPYTFERRPWSREPCVTSTSAR